MTSRRQFLWRLTGATMFARAVAPGVPWPQPSVDAPLYKVIVDERFAIVHDLVERTLRGTPRFVARRGRGHSRPEGGRRASEEPDEVGLNSKARGRQVADSAIPRL